MNDVVIADKHGASLYNFYKTKLDALEMLASVIDDNQSSIDMYTGWASKATTDEQRERFTRDAASFAAREYLIMTYGEYLQAQGNKYRSAPIYEIDDERYYEMLNVLPPMNWGTHNGYDSFFMSEFITSSWTKQFVDTGYGCYYEKTVDYKDKSTWFVVADKKKAVKRV